MIINIIKQIGTMSFLFSLLLCNSVIQKQMPFFHYHYFHFFLLSNFYAKQIWTKRFKKTNWLKIKKKTKLDKILKQIEAEL